MKVGSPAATTANEALPPTAAVCATGCVVIVGDPAAGAPSALARSAVATVAGAGCGGLLLRALGETWEAYATVFVVSCIARLAAIPILYRVRNTS